MRDFKSHYRELNPRPLPYQGSALPLSYNGGLLKKNHNPKLVVILERKTGVEPATFSLEG